MFARVYATNPRRFCQSRDAKAPQRFLILGFVVHKTFNQSILQSRLPCCAAGYQVAQFNRRGNRLLRLLSSASGRLKPLEKVLDEDGRNDVQSGLANHSQPSGWSSRSPGGGSSRHKDVHGESA